MKVFSLITIFLAAVGHSQAASNLRGGRQLMEIHGMVEATFAPSDVETDFPITDAPSDGRKLSQEGERELEATGSPTELAVGGVIEATFVPTFDDEEETGAPATDAPSAE
ncbi:expressed unknown protein [Seminavis robusta]|uniref:Uncharacterized protein n=1 Tax=Seminavis robusta TaxID=568900 RepID=A0A9N8HUP5_9STRA|nr:expressed unknown protein [Seminavis robusta]|eukprot:Sro1851_g301680.1 n/a (110) ;mRNA; f:19235-19564